MQVQQPAMAWALSVRDERGKVHQLDLSDGAETTVLHLKRLMNKVRRGEHAQASLGLVT